MVVSTSEYLLFSGSVTYPTITYNAGTGRYDALCCAVSYSGTDYNSAAGGLDNKSCVFIGSSLADLLTVSTPTGLNPEPVDLFSVTDMGFDGSEDIDIVLSGGIAPATLLISTSNTAAIIAALGVAGIPVIATIPSVFTASGGVYTLDESAIHDAGATLWGGDGAGGERTIVAFTAGDALFTATMTANSHIVGVTGNFAASGADTRLTAYLEVDGVKLFSITFESGKPVIKKIPGRVYAANGAVVTLNVAITNSTGGTFTGAILLADAGS